MAAITQAKSNHGELVERNSQKEKAVKDKIKDSSTALLEEEQAHSFPGQDKLSKLAQTYQERPDDNTYNALWDSFVSFTQHLASQHKDASHLFKAWKMLSQAGLIITEPFGSNGAIRIYSFNHIATSGFIPQTKALLIQWNERSAAELLPESLEKQSGKKARSKKASTKKSKTIAIIKTQVINIPSSIDIKEANFLPHMVPVVLKVSKGAKRGKGKAKVSKPSNNANHYLGIIGTDLQSGHPWLLGLKQSSSGWLSYPDLFADVPSFLVQTNSAKTRFSGNSILISIGGTGGYDLVMPFTDDHFAFSTKEAQDSANAVARQFLLAIQYKRLDLAKVWLSDAKLVSIPAYLGLFSHSSESYTLKLISMPPPICGGSRFRLITGTKDDLIIDVAKIKAQWLIKALFIAPGNLTSTIDKKLPPN